MPRIVAAGALANDRHGSWLCENGRLADGRSIFEAAVFGSLLLVGICAEKAGGGSQICALNGASNSSNSKSSSRPDRCDQRWPANDIHPPDQIISEDVQRHFRGDVGKPFHEELRGAHPRLDRAEGMFDGFSARAHAARIGVEPTLNLLDQVLMGPARHPAFLFAGRALALDLAGRAGRRRPIAAQLHPLLDGGVAIGQQLVGRAAIDVLIGKINKVRFAESSIRYGVGCLRLRLLIGME